MKQSFADVAATQPETAAVETTTVETSPEVQRSPESQSPAVRQEKPLASSGDGQIEGDLDRRDLVLPRINLVQKSGKLGDKFPPGSFTLAKEVRLSDGKNPIRITVLNMRKQYQEDIDYDPETMPKTFNSAQEVIDAGGSLQYGDEGYYKPIATALILIEAPEGISQDHIDEHFIYECEGKHFAVALWTIGGTAYTTCAKKLFTARQLGHLKGGFEQGIWELTSEGKSNAKNSWHAPVLAPKGKTTPEFQAFGKGIIGS